MLSKTKIIAGGIVVLAIIVAAAVMFVRAPVALPNTGNATSDLAALMDAVKKRVDASQKTELEMAPELKQFDLLLAAHAGEKSDAVEAIAVERAKLYATSLHEPERALGMFRQIIAEYPGTETSKVVADALPALETKIANNATHRALAVGTMFPDFSVTDMDGKPLALADYQGKVVLVNFWAAWCPDCWVETPVLLETYAKFHARGFDIIGISLDKEDKSVLTRFISEKKIPWRQFYDGKYMDNALAVKYGVHFIPQNYLLDGTGKIVGKDLPPYEIAAAVAQAMAGK